MDTKGFIHAYLPKFFCIQLPGPCFLGCSFMFWIKNRGLTLYVASLLAGLLTKAKAEQWAGAGSSSCAAFAIQPHLRSLCGCTHSPCSMCVYQSLSATDMLFAQRGERVLSCPTTAGTSFHQWYDCRQWCSSTFAPCRLKPKKRCSGPVWDRPDKCHEESIRLVSDRWTSWSGFCWTIMK